MSDNESLEAKYGRRKTVISKANNTEHSQQKINKQDDNDISKYSKNNISQDENVKNETKENNVQDVSSKPSQNKIQDIRKNIAETLYEYNTKKINRDYKREDYYQTFQPEEKPKKKETKLIKFLKIIVMFLIILVVACTVIAFIMKDKVNIEGAEIIDQINNAEAMYYTLYKRYYYFSKTTYDSTLGIDMSVYKYFTHYEVIHNDETGNYEIKLYGATNAFTITYHTIKTFLNKQL